jgi:hypothetical protein
MLPLNTLLIREQACLARFTHESARIGWELYCSRKITYRQSAPYNGLVIAEFLFPPLFGSHEPRCRAEGDRSSSRTLDHREEWSVEQLCIKKVAPLDVPGTTEDRK